MKIINFIKDARTLLVFVVGIGVWALDTRYEQVENSVSRLRQQEYMRINDEIYVLKIRMSASEKTANRLILDYYEKRREDLK